MKPFPNFSIHKIKRLQILIIELYTKNETIQKFFKMIIFIIFFEVNR